MERSLDTDLLNLALGGKEYLPSSRELSSMISTAELALIIEKPIIDEQLIETGWFLHSVATSKSALNEFGLARQRAAFRISAQIFDLCLQNKKLEKREKLIYIFASQVAYIRSELDPNSIAIYKQNCHESLSTQFDIVNDQSELALSCGIAFLGFDIGYIFNITKEIRIHMESLLQTWGISDIYSTPFGSAIGVAEATRDFMTYFVYGRLDFSDRIRKKLSLSINSSASTDDMTSRWVAAHLLNLFDDLLLSSIWNVLPKEIPINVKQAFTLGKPRVLTFWPPQIELFSQSEKNDISPLSAETKRMFISTPTSSGKSLFAQLIITSHLAIEKTSVYYIAPTRSLCREIRNSLESRLRYLGVEIVSETSEGDLFELPITSTQKVEVMTPERLSFLIRTDFHNVLDKIGLFVFDEVHNIGDKSRGLILEEVLSFLHFVTKDTKHRIFVISAAIGNRNHFCNWIEGKPERDYRYSEWRGPRRLCALYNTQPLWESGVEEEVRSKIYLKKVTYPLIGCLHIRLSDNGTHQTITTENPVGYLVLKERIDDPKKWDKDRSLSTAIYKMQVPIIRHLGNFGSVLVLETTRKAAIRMALALAENVRPKNSKEIRNLTNIISTQLGTQHPLIRIVSKGIAFHHGALPQEIRSTIEDLVIQGKINYLVATTTMTEGVNLPVKSVFIASQFINISRDEKISVITGSKLVNAIGRAGRATKETEGIVVLSNQEKSDNLDFSVFSPSDSDLSIKSILASEEALNELAAYEQKLSSLEDLLIETASSYLTNFISFIWFLASIFFEETAYEKSHLLISQALSYTLGFSQIAEKQKDEWLRISEKVLLIFSHTDPNSRKRWANSGTSLSSAIKIENIAKDLAVQILSNDFDMNPLEFIKFIVDSLIFYRLMDLPESSYGKPKPIWSIEELRELGQMLIDWVNGRDLAEIGDKYYIDIDDSTERYEKIGDVIYQYFEVFLPWVIGSLIIWTNSFLLEAKSDKKIPEEIPALIKWGISNKIALELMKRGMVSRSLSMRIANNWNLENTQVGIYDWIKNLDALDWQRRFSATVPEINFLFGFCRGSENKIIRDLLQTNRSLLNISTINQDFPKQVATIVNKNMNGLTCFEVFCTGKHVGDIFSKNYQEFQDLLTLGLDIRCYFSAKDNKGFLELELSIIE